MDMGTGAIYLGTEQFITLTTVLGVLGAVLIFLVKHQFSQITKGISDNSAKLENIKTDLQSDIKKNYDKVNERIDRVEEKSSREIAELRQNVNDIKGDFATTFVLREDFFRYMNSMEENIKDMNGKVDKILVIVTADRRNKDVTD